MSKTNQVKSLKSGVDIVVGTPGRWMDLVRMGFACHSNLSFWVLDEADRMLDLGFESAIQSVSESIRPDRQTLLFSATFPKRIHALSKTLLSSRMVKITVGTLGQINQDISQHGVVLSSNQDKLSWLTLKWTELTRHGSLLVFSDTKDSVKTLTESLLTFGIPAIPLHGDMTQQERSASLQAFKKGDVPVLVCTDVAARGLDVKHVKSVVNYQGPFFFFAQI